MWYKSVFFFHIIFPLIIQFFVRAPLDRFEKEKRKNQFKRVGSVPDWSERNWLHGVPLQLVHCNHRTIQTGPNKTITITRDRADQGFFRVRIAYCFILCNPHFIIQRYSGVYICPKKDIFGYPPFQWRYFIENFPFFPGFSTYSPLHFRFFLLNKSSYFFPSQPILHIFAPPPRRGGGGGWQNEKYTPPKILKVISMKSI